MTQLLRTQAVVTGMRQARVPALLFGVALTLAGCGGDKVKSVGSAPPPPTAPVAQTPGLQPTAGLNPRNRYKLALDLLQQGNAPQARAELAQLQKEQPGDQRVALLLREIDSDPKQLYGQDSFAYTMQAGDTLFSLAKQYLHDALHFYGLARYNGLKLPADLKPGQIILIPGRAREARHVAPRRVAPPPRTPVAPSAVPAAPPEPPVHRDQAQTLRRQGLEQMSAGSIDRAVTLLSQAASLDPGNAAIAADLARARRIQATVRSQ